MPMFEEDENRASKPRHLLGIADEESVRNAIVRGIDTFDSAYPTRIGRHGTLMTRQEGLIRLKSGKHARSFGVKIARFKKSPAAIISSRYINHPSF